MMWLHRVVGKISPRKNTHQINLNIITFINMLQYTNFFVAINLIHHKTLQNKYTIPTYKMHLAF